MCCFVFNPHRYIKLATSIGLCVLLLGVPVSAHVMPLLPQAGNVKSLQTVPVSSAPLSGRVTLEMTGVTRLYSSLAESSDWLCNEHSQQFVPLLKAQLTELIKSNGEVSIPVAVSLNNLAWIYQHQGQFSNAESHYLRALRVVKHCAGDHEVMFAMIEQNLADMYMVEKVPLAALGHYRKAYAILERRLGPQHPYSLAVQKKYDALRVRFLSPSGSKAFTD
jgi:hypothetical protein